MNEQLDKVLSAIYNFYTTNGYTPSCRELSEVLDLGVAYTARLINVLIDRGLLSRPRKNVLMITEEGKQCLKDM